MVLVLAALVIAAALYAVFTFRSPAPPPAPHFTQSQLDHVVTQVESSVVNIDATFALSNISSYGTGFVVDSSGIVMTSNHVIDGATSIQVTDPQSKHVYQATVLGYKRSSDIAILQLDQGSPLPAVELDPNRKITLGLSVVALGNAGGANQNPKASIGVITALDQRVLAREELIGYQESLTGMIQSNVPIQPGDSGGPLISSAGTVIGVLTASAPNSATPHSFAVPARTALAIERAILSHVTNATIHSGPTAFLGARIHQFSGAGAVLLPSFDGSPAAQLGLGTGDTLVSIDHRPVTSSSALADALISHHPGDTVTITWETASGAPHHAAVRLTAGPAA